MEIVSDGGWVKVHRKILSWRWITSPNHVAVFINLLLHANYKKSEWRKEVLMPGQLLAGRKQIMDWTGLSEKQIRKCLDDLEDSKEIVRRRTNKYSIITILNWDDYQGEDQPRTIRGQSEGIQRATSKKANNIKKDKNNIVPVVFGEIERPDLEEVEASNEAQNILTLLNSICDSNFRPNKTHLQHINARLKEGYALSDFKKVVEFKHGQWANDPKMSEYLRPKTLFGSNFDSYLQAAENSFKAKIDPLDAFLEEFGPKPDQVSAS